jgi:hypothetical protein
MPKLEWLAPAERVLFKVGPLRLVGDIVAAAPAAPRAFVALASFGGRAEMIRLDGAPTLEIVAKATEQLAARTGWPTIAGELAGVTADGAVFRSVARVVSKAANPLTEPGFLLSVRDTSDRLGVFADQEAAHMTREAMEWLNVDYPELGEDDWRRIEAGLRGVYSTPRNSMITGQRLALGAALASVVRRSAAATIRLPGLRGALGGRVTLPHRAIGQAFARHNGFFVRDQYGRIAPGLAAQARPIVDRGIRDGLGRAAIGRELRGSIAGGLRMRGYWDVVAANAVNRARSYAQGATFRAAGITAYQIEAVLDEATTETCRFLHGKIMPLAPAMARQEAILRDPNPEAALWQAPMVREGGGPEGDEIFSEFPDGERVVIARVDEPGIGTQAAGSYRDGLAGPQLVSSAAVGLPPYHHACRTTVVPVIGPIA